MGGHAPFSPTLKVAPDDVSGYMNMATSVNVCNERADNAMMATVVGTALVPAHVNWALTASAMGAV